MHPVIGFAALELAVALCVLDVPDVPCGDVCPWAPGCRPPSGGVGCPDVCAFAADIPTSAKTPKANVFKAFIYLLQVVCGLEWNPGLVSLEVTFSVYCGI